MAADRLGQVATPLSGLVLLPLYPKQGEDGFFDVTPVNRTRNFHNFSLETPEFFDDLYLRLTTNDMPQNRLIYRVQTPEDSVYWVLTRGR